MANASKLNASSFLQNENTASEPLDLLFGGKRAEEVVYIPIAQLRAYPNQPFKPYSDEKLRELADNIAMNGILSPVCVRPFGKQYQILAGHNRTNAAKLAGLTEIRCTINDCDDDRAAFIVVTSNLNQRDELLPSEKAFAYQLQLECIKKLGATTCRTSAEIQDRTGENKRNIQRHIRLIQLVPELLEMVDKKEIAFLAGVNLSFITQNAQQLLLSFISEHEIKTITLKHSELIKSAPSLDESVLTDIFGLIPKPKDTKVKIGAFSKNVLNRYFKDNNYGDEEIAKILENLLGNYFDKKAETL